MEQKRENGNKNQIWPVSRQFPLEEEGRKTKFATKYHLLLSADGERKTARAGVTFLGCRGHYCITSSICWVRCLKTKILMTEYMSIN